MSSQARPAASTSEVVVLDSTDQSSGQSSSAPAFPGPGYTLAGEREISFIVNDGTCNKKLKIRQSKLQLQYLQTEVQTKCSLTRLPTLDVYLDDIKDYCEVDDDMCLEWREVPDTSVKKLKIRVESSNTSASTGEGVQGAEARQTNDTPDKPVIPEQEEEAWVVEVREKLRDYKSNFPNPASQILPKMLKELIRSSYAILVKQLPISNSQLLDYLVQMKTVNDTTKEIIQGANTRSERASILLDNLMRGSVKDYFNLCEALIEVGSAHLVKNCLLPK